MAIVVTQEQPVSGTGDDLPLWQQPGILSGHAESLFLVARRGHTVSGSWVVPLCIEGNTSRALRSPRLLPYATPRLLDHTPGRRRETLSALMIALQKRVKSIELPFSPGFNEFGALIENGAFCETRCTHILESTTYYKNSILPTVRNDIKHAGDRTSLFIHNDPRTFSFEHAVVDPDEGRVRFRRDFCFKLGAAGLVTVVEAFVDNICTGQAVLIRSSNIGILLHSWFDRAYAARGTPTLIIYRLIDHAFRDLGLHSVDLEGSIICSVDRFMDGLGILPAPYSVIFWSRAREYLLGSLGEALDIVGRRRLD